MNYQETLQYLFSQLPMYQRIGAAAYKEDLFNTIELCKVLNNPENKFKSIHIAGTNGKGSTSHFIASVLQEAGYKTGLYTSPHLKDFRERIKINGKMISEEEVCDFVSKYKIDFERIEPSFFELTVGMAFEHFAKHNVDIAVIETGLGGRLDSTNVISPLLSVITNISYDHTALLGDTLEKIAIEKAGIIKTNTPVVIGESSEIDFVFIEKAKKENADITFASQNLKAIDECQIIDEGKNLLQYNIVDAKTQSVVYPKIKSELLGSYQCFNIPTVLTALTKLAQVGFTIQKNHIHSGLKNVIHNTSLLGRWYVLNKIPLTVCDIGHNKSGIAQVLYQISKTKHNHLHFVLGMVNDKDIDSVLVMLPLNATYYFCKANIPRGLDVEVLCSKAQTFNLKGEKYNSVHDAYKAAQNNAQVDDLIFIGGSTFVVAEVV